MPSSNPWIQHLLKVWKVEKPKGRSYKATMSLARKSYKGGKKSVSKAASSKDTAEAAPKKRRRKKKKAN